jgi:CoA:oxalate CoA-transferase
MGREDLLNSPDFMNPGWRIENNAKVDELVQQWTADKPIREIIGSLDAAEIPCGPIRTIDEVIAWDHLRSRNMLQPVVNPHCSSTAGPLAAGFPLKFSRAEVGHPSRVPLPREHNAEIYQGLLKLSNGEVEALAKRRVV